MAVRDSGCLERVLVEVELSPCRDEDRDVAVARRPRLAGSAIANRPLLDLDRAAQRARDQLGLFRAQGSG